MDYKKNYIAGQWVNSQTKQFIEVINPFTDEVIATVPEATETEVLAAIQAANDAKYIWQATPHLERIAILKKALEEFQKVADKTAEVIVAELGSPINWSKKVQVGGVIKSFEKHLELAKTFQFEEVFDTYTVYKEPVGVVAAICPWNYPIHQVVLKLIPALLMGNTVIVKPSSETPLSAYYLIDAFDKAGLPKGVVNFVTGKGSSVGAMLAGAKDVDMVSFTGSTEVGRQIAQLAGQNINKVVLELGGKSPCLVLEGADLALAAKVVMGSCFYNTGQTCVALTRLFVPKKYQAELLDIMRTNVERYKGQNPTSQDAFVGTLVSKRQKQIVVNYAKKALAEGAKLAIGQVSETDDCLFEPIVFSDVTNDMTIAREEVFGPVLSVIAYEDLDDAIAQCNDTDYGLSAAVIGPQAEAVKAAKRIKAGEVLINNNKMQFGAPFGGVKNSGIGREAGLYGLNEYVEVKVIAVGNQK